MDRPFLIFVVVMVAVGFLQWLFETLQKIAVQAQKAERERREQGGRPGGATAQARPPQQLSPLEQLLRQLTDPTASAPQAPPPPAPLPTPPRAPLPAPPRASRSAPGATPSRRAAPVAQPAPRGPEPRRPAAEGRAGRGAGRGEGLRSRMRARTGRTRDVGSLQEHHLVSQVGERQLEEHVGGPHPSAAPRPAKARDAQLWRSLEVLPPLARAVVLGELLGPPRGLRPHAGSRLPQHRI